MKRNKTEVIKGYKVFNPDFTCRGFEYAENTEFKFKGEISMCNSGFHFCEKASDCFSYYSFNPDNWADMWNNLSEDKKKVFLTLPNFDTKKFEIITGIKVNKKGK